MPQLFYIMDYLCQEHHSFKTVFFCKTHKIWYCELCLKKHNKCAFPVHYLDIIAEANQTKEDANQDLAIQAAENAVQIAQQYQIETTNLLDVIETKLTVFDDIPQPVKSISNVEEEIKKAIKIMRNKSFESNTISEISNVFGSLIELSSKRKKDILGKVLSPKCGGSSSAIITGADFQLITEWIGGPCTYSLLYRATRDGFGSHEFHQLCDGISPTLVIVRTDKEKIIGGYSILNWKEEGEYNYVEDPSLKCFLFSISLRAKYGHKSSTYAISNNAKHGPKFGGGHDLEITNNCDKTENQYSQIGFTYNYSGSHEDFYGAEKFKILDYEVFKVEGAI